MSHTIVYRIVYCFGQKGILDQPDLYHVTKNDAYFTCYPTHPYYHVYSIRLHICFICIWHFTFDSPIRQRYPTRRWSRRQAWFGWGKFFSVSWWEEYLFGLRTVDKTIFRQFHSSSHVLISFLWKKFMFILYRHIL